MTTSYRRPVAVIGTTTRSATNNKRSTMRASSWWVLLLLLVANLQSQLASGLPRLRAMDILQQQEEETFLLDDEQEYADVFERYVEQQLDHFEANDQMFFQRYFYSPRYVNSRKNMKEIAFLCVGGEGPALRPNVLVDSIHCTGDMLELAKRLYEAGKYHVHLYALEHRYYGKSYPNFSNGESPVTNTNLKFLSSRQALADLAYFVDTIVRSGTVSQVYTFGGSYPGMLSAWARYKFPHLIHGAVSNSAPIQPVVDFWKYQAAVGWDLEYTLIGGSKKCRDIVKHGNEQVLNMIFSNATAQAAIAKAFDICPPYENVFSDPNNVDLFVGDGVVYIPAQENDPACTEPLCNIEKICNFVTSQKHKLPWQIMADVARQQKTTKECRKVSWKSYLDYWKTAGPTPGGMRSWMWQTCTEFGFYQTCQLNHHNNTSFQCPFPPNLHDVSQDLSICEYAYGIFPHQVRDYVQQSMDYYGGWSILPITSNLISVNGNVDPWAQLAAQVPFTYLVTGASHHFWTHKPKPTDSVHIRQAREYIYAQVESWLVAAEQEEEENKQDDWKNPARIAAAA